MADHHLHLHPHREVGEPPEPAVYRPGLIDEYVDHAAGLGVHELGFTEHLYRCVESADALGPFWESDSQPEAGAFSRAMVESDRVLSLESYVEVVLDAKSRGLPVLLGLEVDYFPDTIDAVLELLDPYPWDFLVGSVHWIGPWAIDTSHSKQEMKARGVDRAWREYFELVTRLAASGTVDVLAHVDLPKKYGMRPEREPLHLYELVVAAAVASGTAVEISSQGLRKPADELYPSERFLQMFHDAAVPVTLASDGHLPEEAGWGHSEVLAAARKAGYSQRLTFSGRRRRLVDL